MHEAFWNGLFDVRWEEAPLGPEAIRLIQRLRGRGYAGRTCRDSRQQALSRSGKGLGTCPAGYRSGGWLPDTPFLPGFLVPGRAGCQDVAPVPVALVDRLMHLAQDRVRGNQQPQAAVACFRLSRAAGPRACPW